MLARWQLWDKQLTAIETQVQSVQKTHVNGALVGTVPGVGETIARHMFRVATLLRAPDYSIQRIHEGMGH